MSADGRSQPCWTWEGNHIVQAVPVHEENNVALTGLVVDVEPNRWEDIDKLEGNYARIQVTTVLNKPAYMYVAKG